MAASTGPTGGDGDGQRRRKTVAASEPVNPVVSDTATDVVASAERPIPVLNTLLATKPPTRHSGEAYPHPGALADAAE